MKYVSDHEEKKRELFLQTRKEGNEKNETKIWSGW